MSEPRKNRDIEEMETSIEQRAQRRRFWKRQGERPLWKNLSMIGALGWLIITPTLLGVVSGRWLDQKFDSGIFWTGAFIFIGVSLGATLAWKRISKNGNS